MKTITLKKSELDAHECIECGVGPDMMDFRVTDKGIFIMNCFECEVEYMIEVVE